MAGGREPGPSRRQVAPALSALALAAALLSGCGSGQATQPGRSDPPGQNTTLKSKRPDPSSTDAHPLANLLGDPVFTALPPGSTKTGEQQIPAHNEPVIFGSGGTFGAAYQIDFTCTAPPAEVYADLDRRAQAAGWSVYRRDKQGRAVVWAKAYPDGSGARLMLYAHDQQKTSPPYTYLLTGSI